MGPPRTPRGGRPPGSCTWGRFVDVGGTIALRDRVNNSWPLDQVTICHGGWGFDDEGVAKLPRPAEYDSAGKEIVKGDRVLILFLEGNAKRPVVIPGFRRIQGTAGAFLPYNHRSHGEQSPDRLAARIQPKDADGNPVGSVDVEAAHDGQASFRASVGPANGGGPRTYAAMSDADGTVQLGTKGGAVFRLAPGQIALVSEEGHVFTLDAKNGIQLVWSKGGKPGGAADPAMVLKEGLLQILATLTQIVGRTEFSDGVSPLSSNLVVAGNDQAGFFFDLALVMTAVGGLLGGGNPASAMATKLTSAVTGIPAVPPGYVSNVAKSTG